MSQNQSIERRSISRVIDLSLTSTDAGAPFYAVPTPEGLKEGLECTFDLLTEKGIIDKKDDFVRTVVISSTLRHEENHATAVRQIGGTVLGYAIQFQRASSPRDLGFNAAVIWRPSKDVATTPLARAAVDIAPIFPSPFDMESMRNQGFPLIGKTIQAILDHNAQPGAPQLPVPRSHAMGVKLDGLDEELSR